ncbi:MAG: serine protein kinase PrkA [Myxococcales bacterium]
MADAERSPSSRPPQAGRYLSTVGGQVKAAFDSDRTILSFDEYLELLLAEPRTHARNSAQYVRDVFDHFGSELRETAAGPVRRFKLFDLDTDGEGRVAGQDEVQNAIYKALSNFVRLGRVNKLILLHGPNGSAKSSIVAAIMRAMEAYSRLPQGALYRFHWIFPSEKTLHGGALGFRDKGDVKDLHSYAHLEGDALDAKLSCELKDHPVFLIPRTERKALLETHLKEMGVKDFALPHYLLEGDLCQKCRQVFNALLASYHGDYLKVLRHVQVERFYVDRRYQQSVVTVEPQMSVDAGMRQVTADRSVSNLPPALQNLALYEPFGPLVAANRGVVEYADLLKRPLEAFKYLLGTSETATVPMENATLHLDQLLLASSNDKHVNAFKEVPDFASFKGRIELVRVPYLRSWRVEQDIYDQRISPRTVGRHVAPHTTRVAAMWAVLTRLKKPIADRYSGALREIADDLAPLEKLELYDHGETPDRLSMQQSKELKNHLGEIWHESDNYPRYEGGAGASAREIKTVLFNAAQDPERACLTPLAVLAELRSLCKDKSVYEYLQQEVVDGYHDHEEFVKLAESAWLDVIDDEIRDSMGLVSEAQYLEMFERYVQHVSHWVKGEKLKNKVTGDYERPSEPVMTELEAIVMPQDQDRGEFRRGLIGSIGAFKLDHPNDAMNYPKAFPELFRRIRDRYFDERKKTLRKYSENVLAWLAGDRKELNAKDVAQVESTLEAMRKRYGYCDACAKDTIAFLVKRRYAG